MQAPTKIYVVNFVHPLPEHVYDVYMKYWGNVRFELKVAEMTLFVTGNSDVD